MLSVKMLMAVDRFLGAPMCLALTACRFVATCAGRKAVLPTPRRILVINLFGMGSTVLACPAVDEIRKHVPGADVFFLVLDRHRAVLDALKLTKRDNIVEIRAGSLGSLMVSGLGAVRRLRREKLDTVIDLAFFSRLSSVLSFLVCRGNRVGVYRFNGEGQERGRLLTHEVLYSAHTHVSVVFLTLVKALFSHEAPGLQCRERVDYTELTAPLYRPDPEEVESLKAKLKTVGIDADRKGVKIVVVNPDSSDSFSLRKWPLQHFVSVCSRLLSSKSEVHVVIAGTESERREAEMIVDAVRYPRCCSLAGKLSFPELLALYSISGLMVTADSWPAHFAASVRLPSVVLFGPETPARYAPLGREVRCLYAGFACSPCVSSSRPVMSPCDRSLCLEAITVDDVVRCSMDLLDGVPSKN